MKRTIITAAIGLLICSSLGCQTMPWGSMGQEKLDEEVGAPPSHFKLLDGRGTGVSNRAKEIEGRLGYR